MKVNGCQRKHRVPCQALHGGLPSNISFFEPTCAVPSLSLSISHSLFLSRSFFSFSLSLSLSFSLTLSLYIFKSTIGHFNPAGPQSLFHWPTLSAPTGACLLTILFLSLSPLLIPTPFQMISQLGMTNNLLPCTKWIFGSFSRLNNRQPERWKRRIIAACRAS